MLVDFHAHTVESDGTLEPAQLAAAMRGRGVRVFSVTDHDALGAYERLGDDASAATVVTGIELNTTYRGSEVHVLGYGFPLDAAEIGEAISANRRHREARAQQMVDQLAACGVDLTLADVRSEAGSERSALGRPHVARSLVRKGYAEDLNSAFRTYLISGKPGYVPQHYMAPHDAIALIGRAGGVAVLAHPGRLKDESIVEELVAAGLAGIEVFYPRHDAAQTAHYRNVAAAHGLVMTAGSDFHDPHYNERGVGMEVERDDIMPFLDLIL